MPHHLGCPCNQSLYATCICHEIDIRSHTEALNRVADALPNIEALQIEIANLRTDFGLMSERRDFYHDAWKGAVQRASDLSDQLAKAESKIDLIKNALTAALPTLKRHTNNYEGEGCITEDLGVQAAIKTVLAALDLA